MDTAAFVLLVFSAHTASFAVGYVWGAYRNRSDAKRYEHPIKRIKSSATILHQRANSG